jgi:hypothetical protein
MRFTVAVWAAAAMLLGASAFAQGTSFYTPPIVSLPKAKVAPIVDGILAPGEWQGAAMLSPFVVVGGRQLPQYATEVRVTYDDHNLYIGARLHDPNPGRLRSEITTRDGPVWTDDCFELLFDTEDQRKGYIHLAVNPRETQYDALGKDKAGDYRWTARAATLTDGWSVELELPFANDYPPAPGIAWGFAAGRHCAANDEGSSWNRCEKSLHELASLGSLVFTGAPLMADLSALGGLWLGDNTAQLAVRSALDRPAACKINARVMGRTKRGQFLGVTKVSLPPLGRQAQNVTYRVQQDGFSTVAFSMTDAMGKTVWRTAPYPIQTPEVEPGIAAIEKLLAEAMREWMRLPAGPGKQDLREDLDALTVQWRYLANRYRDRARLDRPALEGLAEYAGRLQAEVTTFAQRVKTARQSGRTDVKFALTAALDMQTVHPETTGLELGLPVQMDACRNETESAQVVVLPFR